MDAEDAIGLKKADVTTKSGGTKAAVSWKQRGGVAEPVFLFMGKAGQLC